MLRGILYVLSLVMLALALVAGVLDMTRSIADSRAVLTSFLSDWQRLAPKSLEGFEGWIADVAPAWLWDPVLLTLLKTPSWAVFAVISVLLGFAARPKRRRWQEDFGA